MLPIITFHSQPTFNPQEKFVGLNFIICKWCNLLSSPLIPPTRVSVVAFLLYPTPSYFQHSSRGLRPKRNWGHVAPYLSTLQWLLQFSQRKKKITRSFNFVPCTVQYGDHQLYAAFKCKRKLNKIKNSVLHLQWPYFKYSLVTCVLWLPY